MLAANRLLVWGRQALRRSLFLRRPKVPSVVTRLAFGISAAIVTIYSASYVQDVSSKGTILVLLGLCDVFFPTTNLVRLSVYSSAVAVGFSVSEQHFVRRWLLQAHGSDGKSRRTQLESGKGN